MNNKELIPTDKPHIIPFGGCGEFGMNMTAFIEKNRLYVIDSGILFPDPRKLGISSIIPAVSDFFAYFNKVTAYFITHGHEDHIGSLPYIFKKWPAPIYASPWTCKLIERKFKEHNLETTLLHEVSLGSTVKLDQITVKYIPVNHSIPHACSLYIQTPQIKLFHTGDFKIDHTPVGEPPIDLDILSKIGEQGVDLLIADSTNAHKAGPTPSESSIIPNLENIIKNQKGRLFITTFASNLWRLKIIADLCGKLNKKLLVLGRGMKNTFEVGQELNLFQFKPGVLIDEHKLKHYEPSELVILTSGSQAEFRSALPRIAQGEHKYIKFTEGDLIIFSSRIIPGNEKSIYAMTDLIKKSSAKIMSGTDSQTIHVSGHGYQEDLQRFIERLKPKHYLPVHGSFSHLMANKDFSSQLNISDKNSTLISNGDILTQTEDKSFEIIGSIDLSQNYIDQDSKVVLDWETLRERLRIGEYGLATMTGIYSKQNTCFIEGPDIVLHGIEDPLKWQHETWLERARSRVEKKLNHTLKNNEVNSKTISEQGRIALRKYLTELYIKKPIVFCKFYVIE